VYTKVLENNKLGIERQSILNEQVYNTFNEFQINGLRNIPVISMLYSIGFFTILLLLSFILLVIKRQYKLLLAFVPVIFLLVTTTASPVYAEYRYIYGMITCMPILMAFVLHAQMQQHTKPQPVQEKDRMDL